MSGDQYRYCNGKITYYNIPDDMGACTGFPSFLCAMK